MSLHNALQAALMARTEILLELRDLSVKPAAPQPIEATSRRQELMEPSLPKKRRASEPFELKTQRPPKLIEPSSQRKRNVRVVHSMLSHLQKAKQSLEQQQETIQSQRNAAARKQLEAEQQMKEWREAEAKVKEERQQALLGRKEQIDKELEVLELDLMTEKLEKLTEEKAKFCRTVAEPPVFWMPTKLNQAVEEALLRTQAALAGELKSWKETVVAKKQRLGSLREEGGVAEGQQL